MAKCLDLDAILAEILARCLEATGASRGAAYLLQEEERFSLRAQLGPERSDAAPLDNLSALLPLLRQSLQEGEPLALPSARLQGNRARPLAAVQAGSLLIVPLVLGQEHLGALVLASSRRTLAGRLGTFTPAVRLHLSQAVAIARALALSTASEQRFRHLVHELDAIVWEVEPESLQFTFVSRHAEKILGYPLSRWVAERDFWTGLVHPDDRGWAVSRRRDTLARGQDFELEYRVLAADGREVWVRDIVRLVRDQRGRVAQLCGFMVDITKRKRAEQELAEQTARLNALFENSPVAIVVLDPRHHVQLCNRAFERLFLYRQEEIAGSNLDEFIGPQDRSGEPAAFTRRILVGQSIHVVTRRRRKDGSEVDVELQGVPLSVGGQFSGVLGLYQDITERKRAEGVLRRSEAGYRSLIQGALYGIYRSSLDGRFLAVNPALVDMLGYDSEEELLQLNVATEVYADPAERKRLIEQYRNRQSFESVEVKWKRKDGAPITVRLSGRTVHSPRTNEVSFEGIVENVTERRQLERQLWQAQKMEAVGRLAGGIAHDFNNLLTVIRGHNELLLDAAPADAPQRQGCEEVLSAVDRAAKLTQQLLAFSRRQVVQPQVLDLNAIITDIEKMLRRLIREDVELVTRLGTELGRVKTDPTQCEQIIMNLAINARDAMPRGGRLTIETANVELDEPYVRRHAAGQPGSYVLLAVSDTGVGMDKETQAQVFEPFFTTKQKGKGTGLGLATVYGIVKQSDGYIWVYSEPGQGTTFKIYLPRVEQEVLAASGPAAFKVQRHPERGSETIMLVEDETGVRSLARRFLEESGYTVLLARDAAEALLVVERYSAPVHLLLTDVIMPGASGRDLARCLRAHRPEMKVLFISGYTGDTIAHRRLLQAGDALLQKPFTRDALVRKVREVLGASQPVPSPLSPAGD
ncbi:MAG: PAS domain S-box protein [Terriglobia bacterium]